MREWPNDKVAILLQLLPIDRGQGTCHYVASDALAETSDQSAPLIDQSACQTDHEGLDVVT